MIELGADPTDRRPIGNKKIRARREAVRIFKMHSDGMTVREIAEAIGKTEHHVSAKIKIGERFSVE